MIKQSTQRPELLAPAGSLEAFFAALDAGADAVYVGLKDFSARAKAKNFSAHDLERMTWKIKEQGKSLYVALNTLIKEAELPLLIDNLAMLEQIGVSAVIIQDLGVWQIARQHFPGLELHASTQMTIHNVAGVKMLERMGFTRGVLARELTLAEITAIRSQTTLELEQFIHGALCFSFSGQCYFSSFLSGKSGNRGRCVQPCRRNHNYRHNQGYYFSPNDLSAIDLLPQLQEAGICSLKIEGRMKSAEYVHKVVGAYRKVLDSNDKSRPALIKEAKLLLKDSFGRQPTKGFLAGSQPSDMAIPSIKGATGRFLGQISRIKGPQISFKSKEALHIGDRLRIQPATDKSGLAFTVRELIAGGKTTGKTSVNQFITVTSPHINRFKPGDSVFMVSSKSAFAMSDNACRRQLDNTRPPAITVDLNVHVSDSSVQIESASDRFDFAINSHHAERQPLNKEILRQALSPTSRDPFTLGQLNCGELPEIIIPPKQLKQIRRSLYEELEKIHKPQQQQLSREHRNAAMASLPQSGQPERSSGETRLLLQNGRDQRILQDPDIDTILLPLNGSNLQQSNKLMRKAAQIIWDLPFILFDQDWGDMRNAIRHLSQQGFKRFRLNNLGHFPLFDKLDGLQLYSSFRLFALNSQAIGALAELGIDEAELYIEDDRTNLTDLLSRPLALPTALTVYANPTLLTSRIQIKQVKSDNPVLSDSGDAYRVQQRQGLTWLNSETAFSFIANLSELEYNGCGNFILDISHLNPFSSEGKQVLEALRRRVDPAQTSKFNFDGCLE